MFTKLTDREYWKKRLTPLAPTSSDEDHHSGSDTEQSGLPHSSDYQLVFHPLLEKILPRDLSFIEIGAAPGRNLIYFHKYFNYDIAGLDFVWTEQMKETLENHGIKNYELFNMDFTEALPQKKFDVVGSFGFIEHFREVKAIMERHISLVAEGGYLIIGLPNFRWIQFLLKYILDRETLRTHNLKVMKPAYLRQIAMQLNAKEILYCNYYKTFMFWIDNPNLPSKLRRGIMLVTSVFQKLLELSSLNNIPNRFLSPYIILIAKF